MDALKRMLNRHGRLLLLLAVLLMGVLVRCIAFGDLPSGLNPDEASMAYDAYADMTYGMDRNGDHLPVYAVAWGSGQNMGYNYLVRPFIALLGLNAFAVRLPMLLLNCLSLLAFYGLAKACFGPKTGLWALFLLAVCPWHIMLSRWALESNLAVPVMIFAAYFLVKARARPVLFVPGLGLCALCLYAYSATVFFVALFVPTVVLAALVQKTVPKRWLLAGCVVFAVLALPMAAFFTVNLLKLPACRFLGLTIPRLSEMRSADTTVLFGTTPRLQALWQNALNFGKLLLRMDDGRISNAIPGIGAIPLALLPFLMLGAVLLVLGLKKEPKAYLVPCLWLGAALVQGLMVVVNINRINILFPVLVVCAAVGLGWASQRVKGLRTVAALGCLVFFGLFCNRYFNDYTDESQKSFAPGLDTAIAYATAHSQGDVYCTDSVNAPYIYALFGRKADPRAFVDTVAYDSVDAPFRYVYRFERFVTGIPQQETAADGQAYVLHVGETVPPQVEAAADARVTFGSFVVWLTR